MNSRQRKGLELSVRRIVKGRDGKWVVPSQTTPGTTYLVRFEPGYAEQDCDCPDFQGNGPVWCKHVWAVLYFLKTKGCLPLPIPKSPRKVKYGQDWRVYNHIKANELGWFRSILFDLCRCLPEPKPSAKGGRPRIPALDMTYSAVMKVYLGLTGRELLPHLTQDYEAGLLRVIPKTSTMLNWFGAEGTDEVESSADTLRRLIRLSCLPLGPVEDTFAMDSAHMRLYRFARKFDEERGCAVEERDSAKAHVIVGVKTHIIAWATVTGEDGSDKLEAPELIEQASRQFHILEVLADSQYCTDKIHRLVQQAGGRLYSPPRITSTGAKSRVYEAALHLYQLRKQEFRERYRQRTQVESTHSMIKRRLGTFLECKEDAAIECEVLARIVVHNICCLIRSLYEYKIDLDFPFK